MKRYVFGYGVEVIYPLLWLAAIIVISAIMLSWPEALRFATPKNAPEKNEQKRGSVLNRLILALLVSVDLLIPKIRLPGTRGWRPADRKVSVFGFHFPFSYHELTLAGKLISWLIITLTVGVYSIADFVKN